MADERDSSSTEQLVKLLMLLIGPEEDWDDASIDAVLQMQGVTREELADDLREALENEVRVLRAQRKEVPPMMLQAIASLRVSTRSESDSTNEVSDWMDNIIAGNLAGIAGQAGQSAPVQSFRLRNMEDLSNEDRELLESLAEELRSEAGNQGDE